MKDRERASASVGVTVPDRWNTFVAPEPCRTIAPSGVSQSRDGRTAPIGPFRIESPPDRQSTGGIARIRIPTTARSGASVLREIGTHCDRPHETGAGSPFRRRSDEDAFSRERPSIDSTRSGPTSGIVEAASLGLHRWPGAHRSGPRHGPEHDAERSSWKGRGQRCDTSPSACTESSIASAPVTRNVAPLVSVDDRSSTG